MKNRITIWVVCFVALIAWTGLAFAHDATQAEIKTVKLPNGQEVFDISGEWDIIFECYGIWEKYGTYSNVGKAAIKEDGSFYAIRLKDNPPPSMRKAGSFILLGNLDKGGFKKLNYFSHTGEQFPCKWELMENVNKIFIDEGAMIKMTFTRK